LGLLPLIENNKVNFDFTARFLRKSPVWNCFHLFAKIRAWLIIQPGPALAGAGPNARPKRGAPLTSGVITPSWSVNRAMTFLMKISAKLLCEYKKVGKLLEMICVMATW